MTPSKDRRASPILESKVEKDTVSRNAHAFPPRLARMAEGSAVDLASWRRVAVAEEGATKTWVDTILVYW